MLNSYVCKFLAKEGKGDREDITVCLCFSHLNYKPNSLYLKTKKFWFVKIFFGSSFTQQLLELLKFNLKRFQNARERFLL